MSDYSRIFIGALILAIGIICIIEVNNFVLNP